MGYDILTPANSFVQFSESDHVQSCEFADIHLCLPVLESTDVAFQFVVKSDTESEANVLCDPANSKIRIGIADGDDFLLEFAAKPERFRISPKQVLFNWDHGFPDFDTVIDRGECFKVLVVVNDAEYFHSNCFQRIAEECHTSVVEYGNDDDYAGFNYCNSGIDDDAYGGGTGPGPGEKCYDPTILEFSNVPTLSIPYITSLKDKYGDVPSVKVWIYDETNVLVDMGVRVAFDAFPVNLIKVDLGGPASGVVIIR